MGASRELYFWSRGKARGTQPIQKAQNTSFDQLTEGVRRPSTWRESRALGWLAHSESSICYGVGIQVLLSLYFYYGSAWLREWVLISE